MAELAKFIFGGTTPAPAPAPQINIPPVPAYTDPSVEQARLRAVAAQQRAQGRDSTIYASENLPPPNTLKPNLGG